MNHILIYGVPGAGKTTLSRVLHDKTKIPLVPGDYIISHYPGTKSAWRKYGSLTKENAVKGLLDVLEFMHETVNGELAKHKEVILEGVFIDPVQWHTKANLFLIVTTDEAKHRKQFFEHRPETDEKKENFQAVRMIQEYLIEEAANLNIRVIQNITDPDEVGEQFMF